MRHLWIWIILGLVFVLILGSLKDGAVDVDNGFLGDETDDDEDDLLEEFLLLDLLDKEICTLIKSRFVEERLKKGSQIFQGLFPRRARA